MSSEAPDGIVSVAALAKKNRQNAKTLKLKLKKLDARLRKSTGAHLLVRFGDPKYGHLYADLSLVRKHLPGLLHGSDDPVEVAHAALMRLVEQIAADVAALRAIAGDREG